MYSSFKNHLGIDDRKFVNKFMIWLKEHKPEAKAKVPPATLIQGLKDAGIFEQILEAAKKAE